MFITDINLNVLQRHRVDRYRASATGRKSMQEINNKNQTLIIWHSSLDLKIVTGPPREKENQKESSKRRQTFLQKHYSLFFCNNVLHNTVYNAFYTRRKPGVFCLLKGINRAAQSHGFRENCPSGAVLIPYQYTDKYWYIDHLQERFIMYPQGEVGQCVMHAFCPYHVYCIIIIDKSIKSSNN